MSFEQRAQLIQYLLHPNRSSKVVRPVRNHSNTVNVTMDMTLSNVIDMVSKFCYLYKLNNCSLHVLSAVTCELYLNLHVFQHITIHTPETHVQFDIVH